MYKRKLGFDVQPNTFHQKLLNLTNIELKNNSKRILNLDLNYNLYPSELCWLTLVNNCEQLSIIFGWIPNFNVSWYINWENAITILVNPIIALPGIFWIVFCQHTRLNYSESLPKILSAKPDTKKRCARLVRLLSPLRGW